MEKTGLSEISKNFSFAAEVSRNRRNSKQYLINFLTIQIMSFLNPEHSEIIANIKELTGRKCYFKFIDFCNEALGVNVSKKYNKSLSELQDDCFYYYVECYIFKAEVLHDFISAPFIEYSLLPVDAEQAKELLKDFTIDDNLSIYKNLILEVSEQYISEIERNEDFIERTQDNYRNNFIANIQQPEEKDMNGLLSKVMQRKSSGNKSLLGKIMTEIQEEEEAPEDLPKARKCKNCYKFFTPPHAKASHQRYCTIKCRSAAQNKRNKRRNKQKKK